MKKTMSKTNSRMAARQIDPTALRVARLVQPFLFMLRAYALFALMMGVASTAYALETRGLRETAVSFGQGVYIAFACTTDARQSAFGVGYSPSSMNTGNLPQSLVNHYDNKFISNLKANTPYVRCSARRELPENSGVNNVLFMYQPFGANISQAAEGTVGSGIVITVLNNQSTIGNYADYINYSRLSLQTAIDPALENGSKEMAYRLALSLSTLTKNTADGAVNVDASVAIENAYNVPLAKNNITTAVASLRGRNVMPMESGKFCGVMHPFAWGDLLNDNTNNSFTDILKHTIEGQMKLEELPGAEDGESIDVIDLAGVTWYESTLVTITQNYLGHNGVTAYRTYIFGDDGVITISLGKEQGFGDGRRQNLKMITNRYGLREGSVADPVGMIAGSSGYNVNYVSTLPPDVVMRLRYIDAPSAIS
jgi:N4-gp56 family major capsid protein